MKFKGEFFSKSIALFSIPCGHKKNKKKAKLTAMSNCTKNMDQRYRENHHCLLVMVNISIEASLGNKFDDISM